MFVFNRPSTTRRVFSAIAAARPPMLFLIADGPRDERPGEAELCEQVRQIVSSVDWECEVATNFSPQNMGCRHRIVSGLDWVFARTEKAIILEDDCLPDASFFPFCEELLDRYADEEQISHIGGFNGLPEANQKGYSYSYSLLSGIWGWATWRRAWKEYDEHLAGWPEVRRSNVLMQLFPDKRIAGYWTKIFDAMYGGTGPNTWDYQWLYTCWARNWISILPSVNLVENIGFGVGGTHTLEANSKMLRSSVPINFPLRHPPAIIANQAIAMRLQRYYLTRSLSERLTQRCKHVLRHLGVTS